MPLAKSAGYNTQEQKEKIFSILAVVFVSIQVVFPYKISDYINYAGASISLGGVVLLIALFSMLLGYRDKVILKPLFYALCVIALAAVMSSLFSEYEIDYASLRSLMVNLVTIYVMAFFIFKHKNHEQFFMVLFALGVVVSLATFLSNVLGKNVLLDYLYGPNPGKFGTDYKIGFGFTYNPVQASLVIFLSMGALLVLSNKLRFSIVVISNLLFTLTLILIGSRAAIIALFVITVWLLISRFYKLAVVLFVSLVLALFSVNTTGEYIFSDHSNVGKAEGSRFQLSDLTLEDEEDNSTASQNKNENKAITDKAEIKYLSGVRFRLNMFSLSFKLLKDSPVLGVGIGNLPEKAKDTLLEDKNLRLNILGINDYEESVARQISILIEQPPGDYGYDNKFWTPELLYKEVIKQNPDATVRMVHDAITSGAVARHSELEEGMDAHNMYLSLLVELGVLNSLLIFVLLAWVFVKVTLVVRKDSEKYRLLGVGCGVIFIAASMIGMFWHIQLYRELAIIIGLFIGSAYLMLTRHNN